uniref:Uncharacterized protein n=1 Tax=Amphimedon queenslandica TaxID=400682 RepID=A0A1X7UJT2_AMPQE
NEGSPDHDLYLICDSTSNISSWRIPPNGVENGIKMSLYVAPGYVVQVDTDCTSNGSHSSQGCPTYRYIEITSQEISSAIQGP